MELGLLFPFLFLINSEYELWISLLSLMLPVTLVHQTLSLERSNNKKFRRFGKEDKY